MEINSPHSSSFKISKREQTSRGSDIKLLPEGPKLECQLIFFCLSLQNICKSAQPCSIRVLMLLTSFSSKAWERSRRFPWL